MLTAFILDCFDKRTGKLVIERQLDGISDAEIRSWLNLSSCDELGGGVFRVPKENIGLIAEKLGCILDIEKFNYTIGEFQVSETV